MMDGQGNDEEILHRHHQQQRDALTSMNSQPRRTSRSRRRRSSSWWFVVIVVVAVVSICYTVSSTFMLSLRMVQLQQSTRSLGTLPDDIHIDTDIDKTTTNAATAVADIVFHEDLHHRIHGDPLVDKRNASTTKMTSTMHDRHQQYDRQQLQVCFITAQFSTSSNNTDRLFDVEQKVPDLYNSPYYKFFVFTNLQDLKVPGPRRRDGVDGWQIILKQDLSAKYKRFITQSRWPKFQAFEEPIVQDQCQVVFYIDGIIIPQNDPGLFQHEAHKIFYDESNIQLAQRIHPDANKTTGRKGSGGGAEGEFVRIRRHRKDTTENIKASIRWLHDQPDYNKNCTLYENSMFGYAVNSQRFQLAANYFWMIYSKETMSWRDQPLWCYVLDHFDLKPLPLVDNGLGRLFRKDIKLMARKGAHRYVDKKNDKKKRRKKKKEDKK